MEDIQVGEWIRTKDGKIGKIEQIGNSLYWLEDGSPFNIRLNSNKHSFNIKDLIKPMDFVNGMQVDEFDDVEGNLYLGFPIYDDGLMNSISEFRPLDTVEIETILTYEQYNSNCYRLEE